MSEKTPFNPEVSSAENRGEKSHEKHETRREVPETRPEEHRQKLEHIRSQIESEAKNKSETANFDTKTEKAPDTEARPPASKELKRLTLRKELNNIRSKLSAPDKLGSKLIHNSLVRNVSEVSAKTISRPSGLLGGGIMAFLGSGLYYYLTKHIGFRYNYLLFAILFVGGFILGLVIELGVASLTHKKSAKQ